MDRRRDDEGRSGRGGMNCEWAVWREGGEPRYNIELGLSCEGVSVVDAEYSCRRTV